jgi:type IV secretion system protein TrbI
VTAQETDSAVAEQPVPAKVDPETLVLRGSPRRVVRFKRGLLIGIAAVGSASLIGVTWVALKPAGLSLVGNSEELYSTDRKAPPEGIEALPGTYGQMGEGVPKLGPPLPGDLGRPILESQREMATEGTAPSGPSEAQQVALAAAEAERQRRLAEARQAREAPVLVQTSGGSSPNLISAGLDIAPVTGPDADATAGVPVAADRDPNGQQRKLDFVRANDNGGTANPHRLQPPHSPWQLSAGSVIAASLITGLNSDLPGLVVAQVTENAYDSATGRTLLIPQGSRLIGSYDSLVAFGQRRALVVWQRIVLPDGSSIQIDNLPATDAAGYAGLRDRVNFHTWRLLKGVGIATLLGVGTELSLGRSESDLVRAIRESTQQNAGQAGQQITAKNLEVQPTITVRPGSPLRVIVHKDLILRPWRG